MKTEPQIELIDPNELTIHPMAKKLPGLDKEDDRFIRLVESIRELGIFEPLQVDAENRILNGKDRWKAAKQLQLKQVPVIHRDGSEAISIILSALIDRKHYTKGALAYLAFPLFEAAREESRKRQISALKNAKTPENPRCTTELRNGKTVEEFAQNLGFSRELYRQAKAVHEAFNQRDKEIGEWEAANPTVGAKPIDLRVQFEPQILEGEMGLGAALAGIAGQAATKGKERPETEQLLLFSEAFEVLEKRFSYWSKFSDLEKNTVTPLVRRVVRGMPAELRKELAKALKETERES